MRTIRCDSAPKDDRYLFFGWAAHHGYPVLVHRDIIDDGHLWIMGDTGSGKTSLGLAPLLAQLLQWHDSSIVIIDLKADDHALFEDLRRRTQRHYGRNRFRWFAYQPGCPTFCFNPLEQEVFLGLNSKGKADRLSEALALEYGEGYGPQFFSSVHNDIFTAIFRQFPGIRSLAQLNDYLSPSQLTALGISKPQQEQATHLMTVVRGLGTVPAINITESAAGYPPHAWQRRIDLADLFRRPQVLYFWLPAAEGRTSACIAQLVALFLLAAAHHTPRRRHKCYLVIDEFQEMASTRIELVLRQARSMGMPTILSHQTMYDLEKPRANILHTVQGNTRTRWFFSTSDPLAQDLLMKASGEALYYTASWDVAAEDFHAGLYTCPEGWADRDQHVHIGETAGPRLERNTLARISNDPLASVVHVARGHGATQLGGLPLEVRCAYHISKTEYERLKRAPWPRGVAGTFIPPTDGGIPAAGPAVSPAPTPPPPHRVIEPPGSPLPPPRRRASRPPRKARGVEPQSPPAP